MVNNLTLTVVKTSNMRLPTVCINSLSNCLPASWSGSCKFKCNIKEEVSREFAVISKPKNVCLSAETKK